MLDRKKPLTRKKPLGPGKKALAKGGWRKKASVKSSAHSESEAHQNDHPKENIGERAHQALWELLKDQKTRGMRFVEYEKLGTFVVDFFCPAARLVLLLNDEGPLAALLEAQNYRVLSLDAEEIVVNPQAALDVLADSLTLRLVPKPGTNG